MHKEWNLSIFYKNDNDPKIEKDKKEIEKVIIAFEKKWRTNNSYLKDPATLAEALKEAETILRNYDTTGKPGLYFWLRSETDQLNTDLKAKFNKLIEFGQNNAKRIRFFDLNVAKIPAKDRAEFLNAPELAEYKHYLQRLFDTARYQLGEKEENIMSLMGQPAAGNWARMMEGFLSSEERETLGEDGKRQVLSFSAIISLCNSAQKPVRDEAANHVNDILAKYAPIAEHELNSILLTEKIDDELRGFTYPEQGRHLGDDIDTVVVEAMAQAVSANFKLAHNYYALKAKMLGLSKLQYHERGVEVGKVDTKYSYQDSVALVEKVLKRLDPEFQKIFSDMHENGQIDVFPRKGKTGGAFCAMDLPNLPTFILLNHNDKLRDVTTLAHEMGHALNDEYMRRAQPAFYCHSSLAVAEVASTFIEDFVLEELTRLADGETKKAITMTKLNDDVSTIFRQVAAYRFEQELHRAFRDKGYLSKEEIGQIFQEHMSSYMGSAVEQSAGSKNWWVYWSHFRNPFYVYSYASGLLISKALQAKVRKDPKFIEKVKEFFSAGTSLSPKDIFANLGIDITDKSFWEEGIVEVASLLSQLT